MWENTASENTYRISKYVNNGRHLTETSEFNYVDTCVFVHNFKPVCAINYFLGGVFLHHSTRSIFKDKFEGIYSPRIAASDLGAHLCLFDPHVSGWYQITPWHRAGVTTDFPQFTFARFPEALSLSTSPNKEYV